MKNKEKNYWYIWLVLLYAESVTVAFVSLKAIAGDSHTVAEKKLTNTLLVIRIINDIVQTTNWLLPHNALLYLIFIFSFSFVPEMDFFQVKKYIFCLCKKTNFKEISLDRNFQIVLTMKFHIVSENFWRSKKMYLLAKDISACKRKTFFNQHLNQ